MAISLPKITIRPTNIRAPKISAPKLGFTSKARIGGAKIKFSNAPKGKVKLK